MDEQTILLFEELITSKAWNEALIPHLTRFRESDILSLLAVSDQKKVSDDFLRGRVNVYQFLIEGLPRQVVEARAANLEPPAGPPEEVHVGDPYGIHSQEGQ